MFVGMSRKVTTSIENHLQVARMLLPPLSSPLTLVHPRPSSFFASSSPVPRPLSSLPDVHVFLISLFLSISRVPDFLMPSPIILFILLPS